MPNPQPYPVSSAFENPVTHVIGAVADVDLRTKQFYFVKRTTTGTIDVQTTAGGKCCGVLQDKPKAGTEANVMDRGDSKVVCGAAVAIDQDVDCDAQGRAVPHTTGVVVGTALTAGAGAGSIIAIKVKV